MSETSLDRELAQAAINIFEDRSYGHPAIYPVPFSQLVAEALPPLVAQHDGMIPKDQFDAVIHQVAANASLKERGPDDLKTLLRAYRLAHSEQDFYRIPKRDALSEPWISFDELASSQLNPRQRFQRFAHLHMLAYPELLEAIELFAPPGRSESDAERTLHDRFAYTRKINDNIAAYLVSVCRNFDLVAGQDSALRNAWAPPSVLMALTIRRYLELSGYALDRGIETADLLRQCAAIIPGPFFQHHPANADWYRSLRAPAEAILREVGGAQIRLRIEGLIWFTRAGLVEPLQCARVLRERRAKESLSLLRTRILERIKGFSPQPVNAGDIRDELGRS